MKLLRRLLGKETAKDIREDIAKYERELERTSPTITVTEYPYEQSSYGSQYEYEMSHVAGESHEEPNSSYEAVLTKLVKLKEKLAKLEANK